MFPESDTRLAVHHRFEEHARLQPESVAIDFGDRRYSYAALNELSNRAARIIVSRSGDETVCVGILAEDAAVQITGALAVWKTGNTAVMLDPAMPVPGLQSIVADAGIGLLVCEQSTGGRADTLGSGSFELEATPPALCTTDNPGVKTDPGQAAMIVYTSGSTGEAKGVVRSHRYLSHAIWRHSHLLDVNSADRISSIHALTFGAGMADVLTALLNGATLVPYSPKISGLGPFGDWLDELAPTIICPPISFFRWFLKLQTGPHRLKGYRLIVLSGESIYQSDLELFRKTIDPDCKLVYEYGSTEAGGVCSIVLDDSIRISDGAIPIGFPHRDVEMWIVDANGSRVKTGETGQIAVVGEYLSSGYWRKPELTASKFHHLEQIGDKRMFLSGDLGYVNDEGMYFFLGRADNQVKVRGYRVELGAIEACLNDFPEVRQAVVIASTNSHNETELTAYVHFTARDELSPQMLRKKVGSRLPVYMVPNSIIAVDEIPLNSNYKVDRKALMNR